MRLDIKIRCTYSPQFSIDMSRSKHANKERFGYIVSESRDEKCWNVLWDNNKISTQIHKSYILFMNGEKPEKSFTLHEMLDCFSKGWALGCNFPDQLDKQEYFSQTFGIDIKN